MSWWEHCKHWVYINANCFECIKEKEIEKHWDNTKFIEVLTWQDIYTIHSPNHIHNIEKEIARQKRIAKWRAKKKNK